MSDLILFLQQEWSTLKSAPVTFVLMLILGFLVAFLAVRWYYQGMLETKDERLKAKDDQLDDYRERLHLISASGSKYSRLNHDELKQEAFDLVKRIRKFLTEERKRDYSNFTVYQSQMHDAKSDEERSRIWNDHTNKMLLGGLKLNTEYDNRFKIDAIIMRDELLSRLPKQAKNERAYSMYEHPTNPIGMGMVADDLEKLVKSLK